jgi:hypothetical protein
MNISKFKAKTATYIPGEQKSIESSLVIQLKSKIVGKEL